MKKVLVFAGSTSKNSINKRLAIYAAGLLQNSEVETLDLNNFDLPLFNIDLEKKHGIPENAIKFDKLVSASKGIILSLAEHNGSYTAAFKNLFDWLSRVDSKTWKGKPMLLMSTSPGGRGGKNVLNAALTRFPFHNAQIISHFSLPYFSDHFNNAKLNHEALNNELSIAVAKFESSL